MCNESLYKDYHEEGTPRPLSKSQKIMFIVSWMLGVTLIVFAFAFETFQTLMSISLGILFIIMGLFIIRRRDLYGKEELYGEE